MAMTEAKRTNMKRFLPALFVILFFAGTSYAGDVFERYTSSGEGTAIDESIALGGTDVYVTSVTLVLSAAPSTNENLVVRNSSAGALYYDADMAGETSYVWNTQTPISGRNGETLDVEYTNTDVGDWTLTVYYEKR